MIAATALVGLAARAVLLLAVLALVLLVVIVMAVGAVMVHSARHVGAHTLSDTIVVVLHSHHSVGPEAVDGLHLMVVVMVVLLMVVVLVMVLPMMVRLLVVLVARIALFRHLALLHHDLAVATVVILVVPLALGLAARAHGETALSARFRHVDGTTLGLAASGEHEAVRGIGHVLPGLDPGLLVGARALEGRVGGVVKVDVGNVSEDTSVALADLVDVAVGGLMLDDKQIAGRVAAELVTRLHHAGLGLDPAVADLGAPVGLGEGGKGSEGSDGEQHLPVVQCLAYRLFL